MYQVANFDYINEEDAAATAAEEAEREARAKLEAEMQGQGRAQFWDSLLKDKVGEQQQVEFEELGKGKRSRRQVLIISLCFFERKLLFINVLSSTQNSVLGHVL